MGEGSTSQPGQACNLMCPSHLFTVYYYSCSEYSTLSFLTPIDCRSRRPKFLNEARVAYQTGRPKESGKTIIKQVMNSSADDKRTLATRPAIGAISNLRKHLKRKDWVNRVRHGLFFNRSTLDVLKFPPSLDKERESLLTAHLRPAESIIVPPRPRPNSIS